METKIAAIKGPGGKFGRAGALNSGPWGHLGKGWREVIFDRDVPTDECKFELTKPDDRFAFKHIQTGGLFSIDATADFIEQQFNIAPPTAGRGWSESPVVYEGNLFGELTGQVEFSQDAALGKFVSCAFVVEIL